MSALKVREEFIVFQGGGPSLWCYVDAVLANGGVRCNVINGGWSFIMDQMTGDATWASPSGADQANFTWVRTDHIPGIKRGHYNDVLNYVASIGLNPGDRMPMNLYVLRFMGWVVRGATRVKEASRAFYVVLTGKGSLKENRKPADEQRDDWIPF